MIESKLSPVGKHIRRWRRYRGMSQLDLSLEAQVSSRHISFLETGRASASREMLFRLADVLNIPLRERNDILQAAGFAACYSETDLSDEEMHQVRKALTFVLDQHRLFPVIVLNKNWDIVMSNRANKILFSKLVPDAHDLAKPFNLLELIFDNTLLGSKILNWETVAYHTLKRFIRENDVPENSLERRPRVAALRSASLDGIDLERVTKPKNVGEELLVPVMLDLDGECLSLFSTISVFGTPNDLTLTELKIESFYPANPESECLLRKHIPT